MRENRRVPLRQDRLEPLVAQPAEHGVAVVEIVRDVELLRINFQEVTLRVLPVPFLPPGLYCQWFPEFGRLFWNPNHY